MRAGGSGRRRSALAGLILGLLALAACSGSPGGTITIPELRTGLVPAAPVVLPRQPNVSTLASQMMTRMSLDDKLGQLIIIQYYDTTYTPGQQAMVQPFHPGGVILYDYAMGTAQQLQALIAGGQHDSPIPMFTFLDEEGGEVDHIAVHGYGQPIMSAPAMAASGDPNVAVQQGAQAAREMLSVGFNANLAPDVDVAVVNGPDQYDRTFGSIPGPVITYARAFLRGLQGQGVVGCIKHFPGLGAATTDAHSTLPYIARTLDQVESTELAPYRALIASGAAQMVMSTDLLMPALDPTTPAEISRPIITGVLRKQLHFTGVAITDALYMQGIQDWLVKAGYSGSYTQLFADAAVLAIEAGNDMIMAPWRPYMVQAVVDGLKQALANGSLSMAQVDASVRRILTLKLRYHLLPGLPPAPPEQRAAPPGEADLPHAAAA
jgi:beta-N-acetylhexosaminidase